MQDDDKYTLADAKQGIALIFADPTTEAEAVLLADTKAALGAMPGKDKVVMLLMDAHGHSQKDIANSIELSQPAVCKALPRTWHELLERMNGSGTTGPDRTIKGRKNNPS